MEGDNNIKTPTSSPASMPPPQVEIQKSKASSKTILIVFTCLILLVILATVIVVLSARTPSESATEATSEQTEQGTGNESQQAVTDAVARVNGKAIARGDFERELSYSQKSKESLDASYRASISQRQYSPDQSTPPGVSALDYGGAMADRILLLEGKEAESAILDTMIWEELLIQEAEKEGWTLSESQLNAFLSETLGEEFAAALSVPEAEVRVHGYSPRSDWVGIQLAVGHVSSAEEWTAVVGEWKSRSVVERSQLRERVRRSLIMQSYLQRKAVQAQLDATSSDGASPVYVGFDEEAFIENARQQGNIQILLDGYIPPPSVEQQRKDQRIKSSIDEMRDIADGYHGRVGTYIGVQSSNFPELHELYQTNIQTIVENGGSPAHLIAQEQENAWCASSTLNSGGIFCLDSQGRGGEVSSYCSEAACPAN